MNAFWSFARRMLRYRWLVAAALFFATLSAAGLGAGLMGMKPILTIILSTGAPADQPPQDLPHLARDLNATLPAFLPRIPDSTIAALPTGPFNAVFWLVIGLGVLTILGATCNFLHAYLSLTVVSRTIANIRREAFHRVVHLPLKTVLGTGPSDLISRVVYDTSTLAAGFNSMLSRAVAQATKGAAALVAAFFFNWKLTLVALPTAFVLGAIIKKLGKRIRRASRAALQSQAGLYQATSEVLSGLRVVKVHASERAEAGRFHRINKQVIGQEFKVRTARALASPLIECLTLFVLGALSLIAIKIILDRHLPPQDFAMVLGSLALAAASLKPLTGLWNDMQQSSAAAGRLAELLSLQTEPGHERNLPQLPRHSRSVAFEKVSFTYPGAETPALREISLDIPFGSTVAFVGPNGCGKTTLLSLIPRLFDPDAGVVAIDGCDVRDYSVRSIRRQIGVVTQETVLFRGPIRANIAYGAEGLGDAAAAETRIRDAARRARAEEFILEKPNGYDFEVGEGGAGLSGGQKQRIAIARAILRDPAILILDEATSMIDADSEAKIAEAIADFVNHPRSSPHPTSDIRHPTSGRTCLIVAHRLSTVVAADSIVVLDSGRIIDQGTHDELLARCPLYRSLAANQLVRSPIPT